MHTRRLFLFLFTPILFHCGVNPDLPGQHYYDGLKGACGCGTDNAMSPWQANPGPHIYTAAASQFLFAGAGSTSSWCGSGCGTCYELTNIGKVATAGEGSCSTGSSTTITVMVTNLCPANGNQQWCGQETNEYGFAAHFDIMSEQGPEGWGEFAGGVDVGGVSLLTCAR